MDLQPIRRVYEDVLATGDSQAADLLWQYITAMGVEIDALAKENNELRQITNQDPKRSVLILAQDHEVDTLRKRTEVIVRHNPEMIRRVQKIETAPNTDGIKLDEYGLVFASRSAHSALNNSDRTNVVVMI